MTLLMYDSINVATLPSHAQADAGYVDGRWPTFTSLPPAQYHLSIAVFASDNADCLDVEPGDAVNSQAPAWWRRATGNHYLYTSASNVAALVSTMGRAGIPRSAYKIWSAHYTFTAHICGPGTCGYPQADATQYTDNAGGNLDVSLCADDFFGAAPVPTPPPPKPTPEELDMAIVIPAGSTNAPVCVSFDGTPYKNIGFLADVGLVGAKFTTVRVAFHHLNGSWGVQDFAISSATPKAILPVDPDTDGVSFKRLDDVAVALVPNFH